MSRTTVVGIGDRHRAAAPAVWWRLRAVDLRTPGVWDVEHVRFAAAETAGDLVESGSAGTGYEGRNALVAGPARWGGRPDRDGLGDCYIGVGFDRPVLPSSIVLDEAPGAHRAPEVAVDASDDGEHWTEVSVIDLDPDSRRHVVFYAPSDVGSSTSWRLVSRTAFRAPDEVVRRVRLLRCGVDVAATVTVTVTATGTVDGTEGLVVTATADRAVEVDRILIDLGGEIGADSVLLQRWEDRSAAHEGRWRPWRHFGDLAPGRHDLLLHGVPTSGAAPARSTPGRAAARRDRSGSSTDRRLLVLIAAYRDPELADTIESALTQAAYPEHLRFAICHQFDEDTSELLDRWAGDRRFRIDHVDHRTSRGCCWARHRTFSMYDDEPYILQIDAHTRFAARWDVRYVEMLESIDSPLPLLTTYPPRYTIEADGSVRYDLESGVQRLYIDELRDDLTTVQKTTPPSDLSRPGPSPSIAAGQLFTRGRFCRDVDYDPDMYFAGEEISLAARAFTAGYDLFHPTENLVWHRYDHEHPKHWADHADHVESHAGAVERLRLLFREEGVGLGRHGLGTVRSLAEFEDHAGVDLGAPRVATDGTVTIDVDRSVIDPRDDYEAFVVMFVDRRGDEVARREIRSPDVLGLNRASVRISDVPVTAVEYVIVPRTRSGRLGPVLVRSLGIPRDAGNSAGEGR